MNASYLVAADARLPEGWGYILDGSEVLTFALDDWYDCPELLPENCGTVYLCPADLLRLMVLDASQSTKH